MIDLDTVQVVRVNETTLVNTGKRKGQPTNLIHEVTYSDGSVMFRCSTCGKEWAKWNSVFAHRASHSPNRAAGLASSSAKNRAHALARQRVRKAEALLAAAQDLASDIIGNPDGEVPNVILGELAELRDALEEERKARKKAEGDLKKIRSLLTPATPS